MSRETKKERHNKVSNNGLQGTGKQRGFPKFSLSNSLKGLSKLVAAKLASP